MLFLICPRAVNLASTLTASRPSRPGNLKKVLNDFMESTILIQDTNHRCLELRSSQDTVCVHIFVFESIRESMQDKFVGAAIFKYKLALIQHRCILFSHGIMKFQQISWNRYINRKRSISETKHSPNTSNLHRGASLS